MKTTFTSRRETLYQVYLETPFSQTDIVAELQQQNWKPDGAGYGVEGNNPDLMLRWKLYEPPTSPLLSEIHAYVAGKQFKSEVYNTLYSNPAFNADWGVPQDVMELRTTPFCSFLKDKPGFDSPLHLDTRSLVVSGMIYFIDDHETNKVTNFYTDNKRSNKIAITPGFGQGWMLGNIHDTWHDGANHGTTDRYSILYGLALNFFNA